MSSQLDARDRNAQNNGATSERREDVPPSDMAHRLSGVGTRPQSLDEPGGQDRIGYVCSDKAPASSVHARSRADEQRFFSHVEKTITCWLWFGAKTRGGYGSCGRPGTGTTMLAHRRAWEMVNGPVPKGMCLDHICRNRNCVRVEHLDLTTIRENTLRGNNQVAINATKTHCHRGHEFTPENTRLMEGSRVCRACHVIWDTRRREKRRADALARKIARLGPALLSGSEVA